VPETPLVEPEVVEPPPPLLGSWPRLYALVAANLVVLILLFWAFTVAFR